MSWILKSFLVHSWEMSFNFLSKCHWNYCCTWLSKLWWRHILSNPNCDQFSLAGNWGDKTGVLANLGNILLQAHLAPGHRTVLLFCPLQNTHAGVSSTEFVLMSETSKLKWKIITCCQLQVAWVLSESRREWIRWNGWNGNCVFFMSAYFCFMSFSLQLNCVIIQQDAPQVQVNAAL